MKTQAAGQEVAGPAVLSGGLAAAMKRGRRATTTVRPLRVALVGFGTVGSSVAKLLSTHRYPLQLVRVFNRNVKRKQVGWAAPDVNWTESFADVLNSDVDVVVELVGGRAAAYDWVRAALEAGKHVVTANKELIAHHGNEVLELAHHHRCKVGFGAAVAGGVPVIAGILEGLAADKIYRFSGILNGTCNYVLSRMEAQGASMAAAVRKAQALGYAEADPSTDLDGLDALAKLSILARVAMRVEVPPGEIGRKSISEVQAIDFEYARQLGGTVRQVSTVQKTDGQVSAFVTPAVVGRRSPLAHVQGNQNLVAVDGKYAGRTVFAGLGAGGYPTAVAVVSDLLSIAKGHSPGASQPVRKVKVTADFESRHYLRFVVHDKPGIIGELAAVLGRHQINIDAVLQQRGHSKVRLPFVITTETCRASALDRAVVEMAQLDFIAQPTLAMPILE